MTSYQPPAPAEPQPDDDRFTIRWDAAMGCYRVSVPEVSMNGEPVEVVRATTHDAVLADRDALRAKWRPVEEAFLAYEDAISAGLFALADERRLAVLAAVRAALDGKEA